MLDNLGNILIAAGAPLLKELVEQKVGGLGGKLAGTVIDRLAAELSVPATREDVAKHIELDPQASAPVIRQVEQEYQQDFARIAEENRDMMVSYHEVLQGDAKAEGWLQARWRPLFAVAFTLCFVAIVFTICRAIWIGRLIGVEAVSGLLITMVFAGCAVLGVQVYQRTEEKKAGIG